MGPTWESSGWPTPCPADLLSFTLSENGEVLVLQRPNGQLDVYQSSGEPVGSVAVPDAPPGSEYAVSLLADGSMVATLLLYDRIGPWALWFTDPIRLETFGISGFQFGAADEDPLVDNPVLQGSVLFSDNASSWLRPLDPGNARGRRQPTLHLERRPGHDAGREQGLRPHGRDGLQFRSPRLRERPASWTRPRGSCSARSSHSGPRPHPRRRRRTGFVTTSTLTQRVA